MGLMNKNNEVISIGSVVYEAYNAFKAVGVEPREVSHILNNRFRFIPEIAVAAVYLVAPAVAYLEASEKHGMIQGALAFGAAYALEGGISYLIRQRLMKS